MLRHVEGGTCSEAWTEAYEEGTCREAGGGREVEASRQVGGGAGVCSFTATSVPLGEASVSRIYARTHTHTYAHAGTRQKENESKRKPTGRLHGLSSAELFMFLFASGRVTSLSKITFVALLCLSRPPGGPALSLSQPLSVSLSLCLSPPLGTPYPVPIPGSRCSHAHKSVLLGACPYRKKIAGGAQ